ncbi:hypothetical protein E2542_SST29677 [Spatholobus suberectus]|nr:hypothetical protein E2542_SST29677 [Spatholobus suberectus]
MISDGAKNQSSKMSFQITKDDRFFSRLMAKEASTPNTSSRIFYYGETSVAVPFTWEAQPGTPQTPLVRDLSASSYTPTFLFFKPPQVPQRQAKKLQGQQHIFKHLAKACRVKKVSSSATIVILVTIFFLFLFFFVVIGVLSIIALV